MTAFTALRGLRFRLLAAFALVAAVSAAATGALTFREARTGVLQQSQDTVVKQFRDTVDAEAPQVTMPLTEERLAELVTAVSRANRSQHWRVLGTYGELRASSEPGDDFEELTPELRESARSRPVAAFQRVARQDGSVLVVGLPVTYSTADQPTSGGPASGLTLYLAVSQNTEQAYVDALITAIERAAVPALGLAVVLALLAARGVLRPVRALRHATRSMAEGRLDTRLAVNGRDELADLSATFNDTAAALEQSVSELRRMEAQARRFASDVSHELRTPLAAMSAVTDVLDEDAAQLTGETADAVRLVSAETTKLVRLVNDLMEISRFDAGAAELGLDEIDLAESLHRTLASRGWLDEVELVLPAGGTLRGLVDPRRIDVVVANLVGNALRHGAPPVELRLAAAPDGQRGTAGGPVAVIEVADRGPGIPQRDMPHVFERFYKADTTRARSESSGLGLAITLENVRLHGGTVRVADRPGGGTVFTVRLPLDGPPPGRPADRGEDVR